MKKALVIDGNNLIFKAYYATAYQGINLHSLKGVPTNALYAFIRMINKFLLANDYDSVFVAFDAGKTTFRTKMLESYKANRLSTPNELLVQMELAKTFLDIAGVPWDQEPNYEADDLIGTIISGIDANNYQIDIISGDKDLYQLISEHCRILVPVKGLSDLKTLTITNLKEEMGLTPQQIPDFKAMKGDSSDNLPGIKGIGDKTAIKLLTKYGTIENIIASLTSLTPKEQKLIDEQKDVALLTKKLTKINREVPMKFKLADCHFDTANLAKKELQTFYQEYDMTSLLTKEKKEVKELVTEIKIVGTWKEEWNDKNNYVWTEVFQDKYPREKVIGVAISNQFGTFYLSNELIASDKSFQEFLTNPQYQKITWDIKKNIIALQKTFNLMAQGFIFDTMIACYLLYANEKITITNMARIFENESETMIDNDEFYGKGVKALVTDDQDKISKFLEWKLQFLKTTYEPIITALKEADNWELYNKIELPTVYSLITMELNGIAIDTKVLAELTDKTKINLSQLEQQINEIVGYEINPNSPKQMSKLLFEDLKLRNPKKNSTAYDVLVSLKSKHPLIPVLLDYRKVQKLYSTYLNGLEKYLFPDNKIHTIYNQVQTSTGRLSSSEPNMQNITVRNEEQREVRKIFITSSSDKKFISCDYSQIELRVLAHISEDKNLINAFLNNQDIHQETASKVFGVSFNEVTKEQRNSAKAVNFGIIYGISAFGLSQQLKIGIKEAQEFIDKYFEVFIGIKNYIKKTIEFCEEKGYVETIFHRKRGVPEIYNRNEKIKEFGERIAMNMPIQGSAADIIKLATIKIDQEIKQGKLKAALIAQVHDELILEVDQNEVPTLMSEITKIMSSVINLKVPLVVNGVSGNNWYDLK